MTTSMHDKNMSTKIRLLDDITFYAALMAAIQIASEKDSEWLANLATAFPGITRETLMRYHAPAGCLSLEEWLADTMTPGNLPDKSQLAFLENLFAKAAEKTDRTMQQIAAGNQKVVTRAELYPDQPPAETMHYLFCDDWLIFACNDAGFVFTVNTELWPVWLDWPEDAHQEPYAIERYVLPYALEHWQELDFIAAIFSNGHLHFKDLHKPDKAAGLTPEQISGITYAIRARGLVTEEQKPEIIDALVEYSQEAAAGIVYETHHYNQNVDDLVRVANALANRD